MSDDEERDPDGGEESGKQGKENEEPGDGITGQVIISFRGDDYLPEIGTAGKVSLDQLTIACHKIIQDVTTQRILQTVMAQLQTMMSPVQEKAGLIIPGGKVPINISDIKKMRS